jgi:PTS system nitrogen regulatory IIA component
MDHAAATGQLTLGFTESGAQLQTLGVRAESQAEVLDTVATALSRRCPQVDSRAVLTALTRRESEASTHVGQGLAMPHASVEGLEGPLLMDVALQTPVRWGDASVSRCMVLLVPRGDTASHLGLARDAALRAGAG